TAPPPPTTYTLSLHDALPIYLLLGQDRDRLDLDEQVVSDQARDLDERAGRTVRSEVFLAGDVDLLTIGDVLEEHGDLAHVGERGPRGRETSLEILVDLPRLGGRIVAANRAPRGVGGDAAGDEHEAAGAHDIGEVADGLGHPGNADLFTPTDSVHGRPRVSKFEELLVRAPVRSPATT